jgi:hypothetical protein
LYSSGACEVLGESSSVMSPPILFGRADKETHVAESSMDHRPRQGTVPPPFMAGIGSAHASFVFALASVVAIAVVLGAAIVLFLGVALTIGSTYEWLLVLGGIVIVGAVAGVVAVATGISGLVRSKRDSARSPSRALATQGIVLGSLALVVHIALLSASVALLIQVMNRTCIPNGC